MASEIDICNLALGHLGDDATVSSISPPEGSIQAEHCARFFPIARDLTLEAHEWGFATRRANMAMLGSAATSDIGATGIAPPPEWLYVYQLPSDCRNIIKLRDPNVPPDLMLTDVPQGYPNSFQPYVQPYGCFPDIPYELESLSDGTNVVYTNLENAIVHYVASVTDTTKFSAQFTDAVGWLLASYLAGPIIKGDAGAAMAQTMMKAYLVSLSKAMTNDANNRRRTQAESQRTAPWMASR